MNSNVKTAIFWVVIICVAVLLWAVVNKGGKTTTETLTFSEMMIQVEAGKVESAVINGASGDVTGAASTGGPRAVSGAASGAGSGAGSGIGSGVGSCATSTNASASNMRARLARRGEERI